MRVLVIEDDPGDIELLRTGLTAEGYAVDVAATGSDGEACARINTYDAIVLDVMLPDMDGFEIVARLRRERRSVPVLMLTSRSAAEARIKGLDSGADDYLTKPFDLGELMARLRALTRRAAAALAEDISFGALVLDRPAREIRVSGTRLDLTSKEYALLEYLVLRTDRVVSRTDLLENAWDMNFDPRSNVIDAHLSRLRAKLRGHPDAPSLETVRGIGFRLVLRR